VGYTLKDQMRNTVIKNELYNIVQNSRSKWNYHTENMKSVHISTQLMDHALMGKKSVRNPKLCWKQRRIHHNYIQ
jgi:hypothetical protein